MKSFKTLMLVTAIVATLTGCYENRPTSDDTQREAQEKILAEITAQVGMPAIKNGREKKILKLILELRDQEGYVTYTYMENMQPAVVKGVTSLGGKLTFMGQTIGYPIPYTTQFTNPQKAERVSIHGGGYTYQTLPQADPNGLFSPGSADATWVLLKDPNSNEVVPVYSEPKLVCLPFKLPTD